MLDRTVERSAPFTVRDARRLVVAALLLVLVVGGILASDIVPAAPTLTVGDIAAADVRAPRTEEIVSDIETRRARDAARQAVGLAYDYDPASAAEIAGQQVAGFRRAVAPIDAAVDAPPADPTRREALTRAAAGLPATARDTLLALEGDRWGVIRDEAARVLEQVERTEIRDSEVPAAVRQLACRFEGLEPEEAELAAALVGPHVIANSAFSAALTADAQQRAADAVEPQVVRVLQGEVVVRNGEQITERHMELIEALGLAQPQFDPARAGGWILLSALLVGVLLGWLWRFRPELWHRTNALLLVALILVVATLALKVTAGRSILPYFIPTAAAGMLLAILLDASIATIVMALLAVIAGAVNDNSLEITAYVFLGGLSGVVFVRRGDRLQVFLQAGLATAVVNAVVVTVFSLFGQRDLTGLVQLWGASAAAAGGSAVAAAGSFAVFGNLFGILTVFQLLELANPTQPLLRRLLVEAPGTYHHSLMVGNLAERAAEAIGADSLIARVAAYYHDIGKLADPVAFIENQGGGPNIHDELEPDVSAQVLKSHVAEGIDLAYRARLPKALIAFIPQHHGTSLISFFHAKAREAAAARHGGPDTAEGAKAANAVDARKFRHVGPKPQSREAAVLMLADGVEASVRSLASQDEPSIRAMVARIIEDRLRDGQFDECDLTIRDLDTIREAFVQQLLGMYHQRIAYPQNKVVELESRREAGGGA